MLLYTLRVSLALAKAEFKLRNEGSYLGIFWYLLNPLLTFVILYSVFSERLGQNILYYPLYLMLGIIMFNLFRQVTIESTRTIFENRFIIKSINFPRHALIIAIVLKTLYSHIFELLVLYGLIIYSGMQLTGIILYPFVLLPFSIFVLGLALIISALTVFVVDLENIWFFISNILLLGTPIFYGLENQENLILINLVNPLFYFISAARDIVIYNRMPDLYMLFGSIIFALSFFILGLYIYERYSKKFAEMV